MDHAPDPDRRRLVQSTGTPAPLHQVVEALAVARRQVPRLYVERRDDRYRWSFVHGGGPYPLLRETARFLRVDHHRLYLGFLTVAGHGSILFAEPARWTGPTPGP